MVMPPSQVVESVGGESPHRYDRFVRLAQTIFGVPIVVLSLPSIDSRFTVASVSLPSGETPIEDSILQIPALEVQIPTLEDGIVEIGDLSVDERFATLPAVAGPPELRFYAAVPVHGPSGNNGALCILDLRPRRLSAQELQALADLGALVEHDVLVQEELDLAGNVQQRMMPTTGPDIADVEIAGRVQTAREAGGDYFDWLVVDDPSGKRLQVWLGDIMGKGLAASLIASEVRAVIRGHSVYADLGDAVRRTLATTGHDLESNNRFSTLWVGRLDPATGKLDYVDAGHGLAIIVSKDNYRRLDQEYMPLGLPVEEVWVQASDVLADDELLVIMSDGLFDVVDDSFGELEARLRLLNNPALTCRRIVDILVTFAIAQGATDDVTVVAIRRVGRDRSGAAAQESAAATN